MIMMATMIALISYHTSTEVSAGRFTFLKWWIPFHLFCPVFLLVVTGYGYFVDILPASLTAYLSKHNFISLKAMVIWLLLISAVKLAISCTEFYSKEDGQR